MLELIYTGEIDISSDYCDSNQINLPLYLNFSLRNIRGCISTGQSGIRILNSRMSISGRGYGDYSYCGLFLEDISCSGLYGNSICI